MIKNVLKFTFLYLNFLLFSSSLI